MKNGSAQGGIHVFSILHNITCEYNKGQMSYMQFKVITIIYEKKSEAKGHNC